MAETTITPIIVQRLSVLKICYHKAKDMREFIIESEHPNQDVIDSVNALINTIESQAKMMNKETSDL